MIAVTICLIDEMISKPRKRQTELIHCQGVKELKPLVFADRVAVLAHAHDDAMADIPWGESSSQFHIWTSSAMKCRLIPLSQPTHSLPYAVSRQPCIVRGCPTHTKVCTAYTSCDEWQGGVAPVKCASCHARALSSRVHAQCQKGEASHSGHQLVRV